MAREGRRSLIRPPAALGVFIYYDASEVATHIRIRLKVPARG